MLIFQFQEKPILQPIDETGSHTTWMVMFPFSYYSERYDILVDIPKGFITDLASVPRLPLAWLIAGGYGSSAAVVHDFLVRNQHEGSPHADTIFYDALIDTGVSRWRAYLMYLAVRIGSFWRA